MRSGMMGRMATVAACALLLAGCAARERPRPAVVPEPDPLQAVNRPIFAFNERVDMWVLAPTARGWRWLTPVAVRDGVRNFFGNLRFPIVFANDLLQGKPRAAGVDVARFAVNTTVGVAGFLDPAFHWFHLVRNDEDFGQTLGVWGVPTGPYLVIPLLGPSTVRDAAGRVVDTALAVTPFFVDTWILAGATVVDTVNERTYYLEEVDTARAAAFDFYLSVRNGYFQRRRTAVEDDAETPAGQRNDLYTIDPSW
jgi:phospholipid-binding lipoprotein MlaA